MGARCRGASAGEPGERGFARASYRMRGWRTAGQARDNSRLRTDGRIETAGLCLLEVKWRLWASAPSPKELETNCT